MAYRTTTQSLLMIHFPEHLYNQNTMCITDLYITLTLVPSRLIFLYPTLPDVQRDTCPTGVNSTIVYLRLYLINTPISSVTPEILQSKRYRRYLEQAWHKSRSSLDSSRYSKQCHYCKTQMAKAKSDYYKKIWSQIMLKIQVSYGLASIKLPAPFVPNHVSIKYIM